MASYTLYHSYYSCLLLVADLTKKFFQDLESEFGIVVVSRLASYLSSSRHGLTEMELLDLMSSDAQARWQNSDL